MINLLSSKPTALRLVNPFFFSSRRRHTRYWRDWSSDVCSSDLAQNLALQVVDWLLAGQHVQEEHLREPARRPDHRDRKASCRETVYIPGFAWSTKQRQKLKFYRFGVITSH